MNRRRDRKRFHRFCDHIAMVALPIVTSRPELESPLRPARVAGRVVAIARGYGSWLSVRVGAHVEESVRLQADRAGGPMPPLVRRLLPIVCVLSIFVAPAA